MSPNFRTRSPTAKTGTLMRKKKPVQFGKYLLIERLSIGGMAEVFCAKAPGFDRLLALKRVLPYLAEEPDYVEMFADEARLSSQLKHPNIVSVFEFGKYDGSSYLATEYVYGEDLSAILKRTATRGMRIPLDLAVYVAVCVSAGLGYAHHRKLRDGSRLNIIHRDVSPPNIMCSWDGEVKLIDFGIAKSAGRTQQQTGIGVLKGKVGYMSPEQAQGKPFDQRTDVFALGAVLYEMVTGKRLFEGTSQLELLKKASTSNVVPPSKHNSRLPKALEAVILRALNRDPDERFDSGRALHDALVKVMPEATGASAAGRLAAFLEGIFEEERARDRERLEQFSRLEAPAVPAARRTAGDSVEELSDADLVAEDVSDPLEEEARTELHEVFVAALSRGGGRPVGAGPGSTAKAVPREVGGSTRGVNARTKRTPTDDGPTVRVSMLNLKRKGPATELSVLPDFDIDEGQ